jgi:hypothetical protein
MNVEIGTVAAQSLFWKYLFQIYGIGSLQCIGTNTYCTIYNSVNTIVIYRLQRMNKINNVGNKLT